MKVKPAIDKISRIVLSSLMICTMLPSSGFASNPAAYTVKIPKKLGIVKERYRGKTDKLVIHIQDAHTSFDAQKNIAGIIENLIETNTTDTIHVEGAEGEIDLRPLRHLPFSGIRRNVAELFTAQGYLTGSELAGIGMEREARLVGAENMRLYDRNLEKFQQTMKKRDDILHEIEKIQQIIDQLRSPIYPKDLLEFDKAVTGYEKGELDFVQFTQQAIEEASRQGMELYDFVNLQFFVESLAEGRQPDKKERETINAERSLLIVELMTRSANEKFTSLLKRIEEKGFDISKEKEMMLDSFLLKQLRAFGVDESSYASFIEQATFAEKFNRVDKAALLDEVEALAKSLEEKMAVGNNEALELVQLDWHLKLLSNLIELKVVPSQVGQYRDLKEQFPSSRYLNFLRAAASQHDLSYYPSSNIIVIEEVQEVAEEFYRFAEARSRILVNNTVDHMEFEGQQIAALVAGGYHTDGITEALKKKGYSYLVVTPNIGAESLSIPYMERMLGAKSLAEMRFESAFNTLVKQLLSGSLESPEAKRITFTAALIQLVYSAINQGEQRSIEALPDFLQFSALIAKFQSDLAKDGRELVGFVMPEISAEQQKYEIGLVVNLGEANVVQYKLVIDLAQDASQVIAISDAEVALPESAFPNMIKLSDLVKAEIERFETKVNASPKDARDFLAVLRGVIAALVQFGVTSEKATFNENLKVIYSAASKLSTLEGKPVAALKGTAVLLSSDVMAILKGLSVGQGNVKEQFIRMITGQFASNNGANEFVEKFLSMAGQQSLKILVDNELKRELAKYDITFNVSGEVEGVPSEISQVFQVIDDSSELVADATRGGLRGFALQSAVQSYYDKGAVIFGTEVDQQILSRLGVSSRIYSVSGDKVAESVSQEFNHIRLALALALQAEMQKNQTVPAINLFEEFIAELQGIKAGVFEAINQALERQARNVVITQAA